MNIQSRDKLLKACDTPDYDHLEVISSDTFDEEFLRGFGDLEVQVLGVQAFLGPGEEEVQDLEYSV